MVGNRGVEIERFMLHGCVDLCLGTFGFFGNALDFRKLRIQNFAKGEDSKPEAIMQASDIGERKPFEDASQRFCYDY